MVDSFTCSVGGSSRLAPRAKPGAAAAHLRAARLVGLDRLRGLAVLLMVADHVLVAVDPSSLARFTITRLSLPLFCLVAGSLAVRARRRRLLPVAVAGVVVLPLEWAAGLGVPGPLLLVALAVAVCGLAARVRAVLPPAPGHAGAGHVVGAALKAGRPGGAVCSPDGVHEPWCVCAEVMKREGGCVLRLAGLGSDPGGAPEFDVDVGLAGHAKAAGHAGFAGSASIARRDGADGHDDGVRCGGHAAIVTESVTEVNTFVTTIVAVVAFVVAATFPWVTSGYHPAYVVGLVALGVGQVGGLDRLGARLPAWLELPGRRPVLWYLAHVAVLAAWALV